MKFQIGDSSEPNWVADQEIEQCEEEASDEAHKNKKIEVDDLCGITCDVCKTKYEDPVGMGAFFHLQKTFGYGSIFGDGNKIECDVCELCLKEVLGQYLRINEQEIRE